MSIVASGQLTLVDLNDSKQLIMFIGSSQQRQVIYNPNASGASQYVPNYSTANNVLTPQLFIAGTNGDIAGTIDPSKTRWFVQVGSTGTPTPITASDTNYTLGTGKPVTLTIKNNVLASNNSMTYICEMDYMDTDTGFTVTAKAEYEIVKVTNGMNGQDGADGKNAIMGILSNDSHTIPTDSSGNGGTWSSATTTMFVYVGTTDDSANWTYTAVATGCTGAFSTTGAKNVYTLSAMSADLATVDITAKKTGNPDIVKRFTISKNKAGANGASASAYWLLSSNVAISKNASGNYVPANLTITAKTQTGSSAVADYKGRFSIYESTDGTTFPNKKYESTADETTGSYTYTPSAGIKSARIRLYQAGGLTVLLDEQIIPVVTDGLNQISAVVWTPDGNTIKNANGTLTATCDVYNGSTIQTSGVTYKWYFQDPNATIANGKADADGGDGWQLMKDTATANGVTGYTTKTITIPASSIVNIESFKCVATYLTIKYRDVCTILDVSDPFMVTIVGINTFKNGVGVTDLTAKIYQGGVEIDQAGTGGYTYTWYLYDNNNVKMTSVSGWGGASSKTGKTIRVDGADVTTRGNIICEVSK